MPVCTNSTLPSHYQLTCLAVQTVLCPHTTNSHAWLYKQYSALTLPTHMPGCTNSTLPSHYQLIGLAVQTVLCPHTTNSHAWLYKQYSALTLPTHRPGCTYRLVSYPALTLSTHRAGCINIRTLKIMKSMSEFGGLWKH